MILSRMKENLNCLESQRQTEYQAEKTKPN